MAGADLDQGAAREVTAQLLTEPANPHDPNAVSVQVEGQTVGYLPREIAPKYASVLTSMRYFGLLPSVPAHMWARAYDDYDERLDGTYAVIRRSLTRFPGHLI
jgi:HIRAN domain-containing protein